MKKIISKLTVIIILLSSVLFAQKVTIFAASDLKFALDAIKKDFLKEHKDAQFDMIYGSSGKGMVQIANGAPYDLYFSANMDYVKKLYAFGQIVTKPKLYAIGRIVIWSKSKYFNAKDGFANLLKPWVKKIAIANPSHAPYGQKSKQALSTLGLYEKLKPNIVFGSNISSTAGYISSQATDIGIIALSLALSPNISQSKFNKFYLINKKLHKPLKQGYGITKYGANSKLARKFYDFFQTQKANAIMHKFGFNK
jgi:molybdate transport system substrate-binding protein